MSQLCKECLLPSDYAGIRFNDQGVCNLCKDYNAISYLGKSKLKEDVSIILNQTEVKNKYDCIVGFSGGRDSTYLLWYIVNELKLKPLAVFVDSMLIPDDTISNVRKTVELLNVDLVIKKHEYLKNSVTHFLKAWIKYPDPATLITLCTGCRLGVSKFVKEEVERMNIPIVFQGGTPFEKGFFKKSLISTNRNNHLSFIFGYAKQIVRNPSLLANFNCLITQINEYIIAPNASIRKGKKDKFEVIDPFYKYFRWEEKEVEETIKKELGWKPHKDLNSSYRGDCIIGIIRQFLYYKILGYNDKDDHLSWLIRDGQISRNEAFIRLKKEKETSDNVINSSFSEIGIDFREFLRVVEKNAQKNKILHKNWKVYH